MGLPLTIAPMTKAYWPWLQERAHPVLCEDSRGFVVLRGTEVVAAAAFDSWSYNSCLTHMAIEDPKATRRLLRVSAEFIFLHAGRGIALGLTPADNEQALRLNRGIGFKEIYRMRDGYKPGVDFVLQEMRRETCRWLRPALRKAA